MMDQFDNSNSKKNLRRKFSTVNSRIDNHPPYLIPDVYLKPRVLAEQVDKYNEELYVNTALLAYINLLNKTEGSVDCWADIRQETQFLRNARIQKLKMIAAENKIFYKHLEATRPITVTTKELLKDWKKAQRKLKTISIFPYSLSNKKIPEELMNISSKQRFWMEFKSDCQNLGVIIISLFDKVCPRTCEVFKSLVKGIPSGYAYSGTAVFSIIPGMLCTMGDVVNNNGFGGITLDENNSTPENFLLHHSLPGILSMKVFDDRRVNGIFNLTLKPMPLLDGRSVVFGRITGGSTNLLDYLNKMGSSLGLPRGKPHISNCGWIGSNKKYRYGPINRLVKM